MSGGIVRPVAVTVRQEGTNVVVIREGRAVFDMPWDAALQLARAIFSQAKRAEELASAERIAEDQAVLLRLGVPVGLSSRRDIQEEAQKRAALKEQAVAAHTVLDRRQAVEAARRKLAEMSDVEKAALAQIVAAEGIESGEAVVGF